MSKELFERFNKTKIKGEILSKSKNFGDRNYAKTRIPFLNLALSGKLNGGIYKGLTFFAAPSKHFKTSFILVCMKAWQEAHPNGVSIFYDSEHGASLTYFKNFGIDSDKVLRVPIDTIEDLKQDLAQKLNLVKKGEEVSIWVDSVGNLPSKKEKEDAIKGDDKQDMTRAKALASLCRIITQELNEKDIPCSMVNHTYEEQKMYGKRIMSGGEKPMLSANNVIFITRTQNKDGDELSGYTFNMVIEKSRDIKERSKFPITVGFDEGIDEYSGVFEHAVKFKFITSEKKGWFTYKGQNYRKKDIIADKQIFDEILTDPDFVSLVEGFYSLDVEVKLKGKEVAEKRGLKIDDKEVSSDDGDVLEEMFSE